MASKSKKRRRVLGASCILAALIIAGSSFAWFTSRDEVTNRLSASSDYGVSIVESFTPPKNWLPGQEINKDVYAVNTGNIAAFVKEDVKGKLNYTYESKVAAWDADCVKLTLAQVAAIQGGTQEDGFKTMEGGGFLAWTDATVNGKTGTKTYKVDGTEVDVSKFEPVSVDASSDGQGTDRLTFSYKYNDGTDDYYLVSLENDKKLYKVNTATSVYTEQNKALSVTEDTADKPAVEAGPIYSGREQDITEPWTPTVNGTYIFRRSIGGTADNPTFEYAGYYYKDGEYYKIVIGNDGYRAESETPGTPNNIQFDVSASKAELGSGVKVDKDGIITEGKPKISYVKDTKVENKDVTFKYEDATTAAPVHGPRLVATYSADGPTFTEDGKTYDASAYAARREVDYYNKLGVSNEATVNYEMAKARYDYETALAEERGKLIQAAIARKTADDNLNGTTGALSTYNTKWNDLKDAAKNAITKYNGVPVSPATATGKALFLEKYLVEDITPNTAKLFTSDVVTRIKNNSADPVLTEAQKNLTKLKNLQDEIVTLDGKLWTEIAKISNAADKLTPTEVDAIVKTIKDYLDEMNKKMVEYKNAYSAIVDSDTTATALGLDTDATAQKKAGIQSIADLMTDLKDDMDNAITEYRNAYDDYQKKVTANTNAQKTWEDAIDTYNRNVGLTDEGGFKGARKQYQEVVTKTTPTILPQGSTVAYTDESNAIVPFYSANRVSNAVDPTIDKDTAKTKAQYEAIADWTVPDTSATPNIKAAPTAADYSLSTKKQAMDDALKATNEAKNAYDSASDAAAASSNIKIYVNLDKDYATNWTIDPADKTASQDVDFYLNSILDAGETSAKLIDSVELADTTTTKDYKDLTFDLNVGLESAQITYANDQKTITTEATEGWVLKPTLTDNQSLDTAVSWSDTVAPVTPATPATLKTYTVASGAASITDDATVETPTWTVSTAAITINQLAAPVSIDGKSGTYSYVLEQGGKKYYGTSTSNGAIYTEASGNASPFTAGKGQVKLTNDATEA